MRSIFTFAIEPIKPLPRRTHDRPSVVRRDRARVFHVLLLGFRFRPSGPVRPLADFLLERRAAARGRQASEAHLVCGAERCWSEAVATASNPNALTLPPLIELSICSSGRGEHCIFWCVQH